MANYLDGRESINNKYETLYEELECMKQRRFSDIFKDKYQKGIDLAHNNSTINPNNYLHHSIGFDNDLEVFEYFLQIGKIVAGDKIPNYHNDPMNSNEGKYISLLAYDDCFSPEYMTFIKNNHKISMMINTLVNPLEAIYVSKDVFSYISTYHKDHKNRYAWAYGEYHIEEIPFNYVTSIGIPYGYLEDKYGTNIANIYLSLINKLLKKYDYDLPIYDNTKDEFVLLKEKNKQKVLK